MTRIAFDLMQEVVTEAFVKAGMTPAEAAICAKVHTESSCDGVYSHGLNRVARFVDYLQRGWVVADAKPERVKTLGAIEIYDGKQGPGILNALFATDRAMELAAEQGVGIVALRNTTHWMRGGSYGWRAADKGFAAISWTNTESCMPAWGGKNPRLGNNPFVMAVPRKKGHIVLDMAMSQYSYGKLQVTRLKGEQLPYPGGFDAEGNLTTERAPSKRRCGYCRLATGRALRSPSFWMLWPQCCQRGIRRAKSTRSSVEAAPAVRKCSWCSIRANSAAKTFQIALPTAWLTMSMVPNRQRATAG